MLCAFHFPTVVGRESRCAIVSGRYWKTTRWFVAIFALAAGHCMCALLFLIKKLCQDFARAFQTQLEDLGAGAKFGDIFSHLLHLLLPYSLAKCLASIRRHGEHALLNSLIFGLGAESLLRVQMGAARSGAKERRSPWAAEVRRGSCDGRLSSSQGEYDCPGMYEECL